MKASQLLCSDCLSCSQTLTGRRIPPFPNTFYPPKTPSPATAIKCNPLVSSSFCSSIGAWTCKYPVFKHNWSLWVILVKKSMGPSFYLKHASVSLITQISIQKCDKHGDNRLRVCHSACQSYNRACGASLDCSDLTLFSSESEGGNQCTGSDETSLSRGRLALRGKTSRALEALRRMFVLYR